MDHDTALRLMEKHGDAWNGHDVDVLMALFAPDCVFETAAGPHPYGTRHSGHAAVRDAFAAIWAAFPDARWDEARHIASGHQGCSEWTFRGTRTDGTAVEVRGVDLLHFRDGLITRKDTFRKAVTP
ncbi:MAG: hypothetical protein K0S00_620 [Xanthobacteraceae bacterium]|jgi:steroid delta-isomerase-like uncharacterized protein|nr:hypothetical protein [Xanthobacteraceae bacterium]